MEQETNGAIHGTGKIRMPDGVELFHQEWTSESARAHVIVIHGYGEHSSRYDHVAARLNGEGFSVYSYDQRGHGNSPGRMGFIPSFDRLVDDLDVYVNWVQKGIGDAPLFLFGHSMGGLVLAAYAIRYKPDVRALAFSGAGVKSDDDVTAMRRRIAGLLASIVPHVPVLTLDTSGLSRIEEVVTRYNNDPLVYHGKIGAKTGQELLTAIDFVQQRMGEITLPLIALHGKKDRLVSYHASESLYEKATSQDKTLKLYDDGYHEVFNDLDAGEFMDDLIDWLRARL